VISANYHAHCVVGAIPEMGISLESHTILLKAGSTPSTQKTLRYPNFDCRAALTRSGVMRSCSSFAPVASWTAVASTPPMQVMAGSPPPLGGSAGLGTITVSILGTHENRGIRPWSPGEFRRRSRRRCRSPARWGPWRVGIRISVPLPPERRACADPSDAAGEKPGDPVRPPRPSG
jgi:hypothetical protein